MRTRIPLAIGVAVLAAGAATSAATAAWNAPATVSSVSPDPGTPTFNAEAPVSAVGGDGVVTAAWVQEVGFGNGKQIRAARFRNGAWSPSVALSGAGIEAGDPAVAADAQGDVIVVWRRGVAAGAGQDQLVQAARFSGGAWSVPSTLWSQVGRSANTPGVAFDGNGNALAVWGSCATGDFFCATPAAASARFSGGTWAAAVAAPPAITGVAKGSVTAGAPGQVSMWWYDALGPASVASWSSTSGWAAPWQFTANANQPALALNASGAGVLAWHEANVVKASILSGGTWGTVQTISPGDVSASDMAATIDAAGTATVAWQRYPAVPGGPATVQAIQRTGGTWGAVQTVSGDEPNATNPKPAITSGPTGHVTVTWNGLNGSQPVLRARSAVNGVWDSAGPADISTPAATTTFITATSLASDPLGRVMAVWQSTDANTNVVKAARMQGVPDAPSGAAGTSGDTRVTVAWTAPADDGGAAISTYRVTAQPGGKTCTVSGATTCAVTGLTNGTPYTFTVIAGNAIGTGPESVASAPVTPRLVRVVGALKTTVRARGRSVTTTGTVPTGATRVTQRATARGKKARAGRCRILSAPRKGAPRAYRCTLTTTPARWTVVTEARDARGVMARSTRTVRIR